MRSPLDPAILRKFAWSEPQAVARRGRVVFSSSKSASPTDGVTVLPRSSSLVSSLKTGVTDVANALFATIFPDDCRLCGTPLTNISRLPVCERCLHSLNRIEGTVCAICGERLTTPYAISEGEARCGLCLRAEPPYTKAAAYGSYEGGLRDLIHLLKYDHVRPAAAVLGRMLAEAIADLSFDFKNGAVLVVPVPLFAGKFRQRGFNQSELIVKSALKLLCGTRFELNSGVLVRQRETQSQIGLSRHQRRENMRGAFAIAHPEEVVERDILLVDDVLTTGTTAAECARVLRRAGASKVYVATVARTLKTEVQGVKLPEFEDPLAMAAHG